MDFLQAVAREEGFYAPGTRPQRNNNPGDIEYGKFAIAHGATGSDGRFAIFTTADGGFAAMKALFMASSYKNLTVAEALIKWAPPSEAGQDSAYTKHVCAWVGCLPTDKLAAVLARS